MKCRICRSGKADKVGELLVGGLSPIEISDCGECGCRFADYDIGVYEHLHTHDPGYLALDNMARRVEKLFADGDRDGLRRFLSRRRPAWRFIIDSIEQDSQCHRVLEVGSARGVLGAYFILAGYDYVGTDISATAVESAVARFGPHFMQANELEMVEGPAFDAVFHSGTIGCVEDPVQLTSSSLGLLRDGGHLLFNAPSVAESRQLGALWMPTTNPPDLVTLFPVEFWSVQFPDCRVAVDEVPIPRAVTAWRMRRAPGSDRTGRVVAKPAIHENPFTSLRGSVAWVGGQIAQRTFGALPNLDRRVGTLLGQDPDEPRLPSSFGVHVDMTKGNPAR